MSVWRNPIRDRWPCRRSSVLSLLNVPQVSRYSFSGKAFGSKVVLSFCARRELVDELPLVRGHDKAILPDIRFDSSFDLMRSLFALTLESFIAKPVVR